MVPAELSVKMNQQSWLISLSPATGLALVCGGLNSLSSQQAKLIAPRASKVSSAPHCHLARSTALQPE